MRTSTASPRPVRKLSDVVIPLPDGTRLRAHIWLPEDAARVPVPAILEYLPYRKNDGTVGRDALIHPHFAAHGYAAVRVDMRGSGDSEGVLLGEYLPQEQDDGVAVIDWLSRQPWCTGAVGMIGISWGGFNGLQIAARRPPALKAIVSICSIDDRYAGDIHATGGAPLNERVTWGSRMLALSAAPPDPAVVGEAWRDMWRQRLDALVPWTIEWLRHQRRDAFYRQGSICEDWSAIQCPTYLVGGWADSYRSAVLRMLANLQCPRKGLIGPWAHAYPHIANPGPAIGFLTECRRWFDHWLKGHDTGIVREPMLRAWIEEPARPSALHAMKPGRWVAEATWPSSRIDDVARSLLPDRLGEPGETAQPAQPRDIAVSTPLTVGFASGKWCSYGATADQPLDQRLELHGVSAFDSRTLAVAFEVLGTPVIELTIAADKPQAMVAVTLSEVFPDGAATRVTFGILNLAHRDGSASPQPLEPGRFYRVRVPLEAIGHRFGAGNRLRVALSTSYWPNLWPSPERATLTMRTGRLLLPVRPPDDADERLVPFGPPEISTPERITVVRPAAPAWSTTFDHSTGEQVIRRHASDGTRVVDAIDLEVGTEMSITYRIRPDDPCSARVATHTERHYRRGDWHVASTSQMDLWCTRDQFVVAASLTAREGARVVFERSWSAEIPRDNV